MTARLIKPDGTVARAWATDRPSLASTADRNFPAGWRVETVEPTMSTSCAVENFVSTRGV